VNPIKYAKEKWALKVATLNGTCSQPCGKNPIFF
jgi:hypothetical protein